MKPQDLYVCLGLVTSDAQGPPSFGRLAAALMMSPSQVHAAVGRATAAGLIDIERRPRRTALLEFILRGVRYAFYPQRGGVTRGVATAAAAPPLVDELAFVEPLPVWPHPEGSVRGESLDPLHRGVPMAALADPQLHELLALVDAMRIGRARERKLAEHHLTQRLAP